MRKMVFGRKLSRGKKSREALFRSLTRAVILDGKIITTMAKAKSIKGQIDKLATLAKEGTLATRRRALAFLANDREATDKLFGPIAKAVFQRNGGFTRIVALPSRKGDAAKMARIEWVDEIISEKIETEKGKEAESKKNKKAKKTGKISKKAEIKTVKKETQKAAKK
jgi:large subunit ribosomal protein L17